MGKAKLSNIFVWIILLLLIVALAGFSTGGFGQNVRAIGTVGSKDILTQTYARELQNELRALSAQTGQAVPLATAQQLGLDRAVLGRVVASRALDHEADAIGLSVGDEEVRRQVLEIPAFRDLNGEFDREAYAFTLRQSGLSEVQFEEQLRETVSRDLLQGAVGSGATPSQTYVDTLYNYYGERRDFTWALITEDALETPVGLPSEDQLQTYYDENPDAFTLPETKRITYAWLSPAMVADEIEIDEATLRQLYDERLDIFVQPERRLVERLVFGSNEEAAAAKERLDAGELTFTELVEERGLSLQDIDMGERTEGQLGDAGADIFALGEPGVVGPLPSSLGPALFRMNGILSAQETPFEEIREDLARELSADRARRVIADRVGPIDDLLAGGATLEELVDELGMTLGTIDWYPAVDEGIAAYANFRDAAVQLASDDFPEIFELEDGGIFAMRLDETLEPRLQPLDEVRGDAIEGWQDVETATRLRALADATQEQLAEGNDLAAEGLTVMVERNITRDNRIPDAPPLLVLEVFEMERNEVRVVEGPQGAALVRLDEILGPDDSDPEITAIRSAIETAARQDMAQDVLQAFGTDVQSRAGLQLNHTAINAVHANF